MPLFSELAACEIDRLALGATRIQLTRGKWLSGAAIRVRGSILPCTDRSSSASHLGTRQREGGAPGRAGRPFWRSADVPGQAVYRFGSGAGHTQLLYLTEAAIMDELKREPDIAGKLLAGLSVRLHALMDDIQSYFIALRNQAGHRLFSVIGRRAARNGTTGVSVRG